MFSTKTVEDRAKAFIDQTFNEVAMPKMQEMGPIGTMFSLPFFVEGAIQAIVGKPDVGAEHKHLDEEVSQVIKGFDGKRSSEALYIAWRILQHVIWGMAMNRASKDLQAASVIQSGEKINAAE